MKQETVKLLLYTRMLLEILTTNTKNTENTAWSLLTFSVTFPPKIVKIGLLLSEL